MLGVCLAEAEFDSASSNTRPLRIVDKEGLYKNDPRVVYVDGEKTNFEISNVLTAWETKDLASLNRTTQGWGPKIRDVLTRAVKWVLNRIRGRGMPTAPLAAPERGLKTRYPTLELAAGNLVHQLFRRAADAHLFKDRRMSAFSGGSLKPPRMAGRRGPWYSADLSYATDLHPHWLTIQFYDELITCHPELEEWREYLETLCGPRWLLSHELDRDLFAFTAWHPDYNLGDRSMLGYQLTQTILTEAGALRLAPTERTRGLAYITAYAEWIDKFYEFAGVLTTGGAMMGSASSWPLLPLVSVYSAEEAGRKDDGLHCGDDALYPEADDQFVDTWERTVQTLGGVLSRGDPSRNKPEKIYKHPRKGIFTEVMYLDGRPLTSVPISVWSAPAGGSKGQVNWFTQASSVRQIYRDNAFPLKKGLWNYSPLYWEVQAAWSLGLPVREPPALGGIHHPGFPHRCLGYNQQWLTYLNSLTLEQLTCGTGLNPLPSPNRDEVTRFAKSQVGVWSEQYKEYWAYASYLTAEGIPESEWGLDPPPLSRIPVYGRRLLPLIKDAVQLLAHPVRSWDLYSRPIPELNSTPSIEVTAKKFVRKVRRVHVEKRGSFLNTQEELGRKSALWVRPRINDTAQTWYGLAPSVVSLDSPEVQMGHTQDGTLQRMATEVGIDAV